MPPPSVGVGDIVQVTIEMTTDATTNLNVLHYRCISQPTEPSYLAAMQELLGAVSAVGTGVTEFMTPLMDDRMAIVALQAQRVRPQRDYYVRLNVNKPGLVAGSAAPPNCAMSITKRTESVGKGITGHFQMGGLSLSTFSEFGTFTNAAIATGNALGQALAARRVKVGGNTDVWEPGMLSVTNTGFNPIRAAFARSQIRTMHRRTVGVGI